MNSPIDPLGGHEPPATLDPGAHLDVRPVVNPASSPSVRVLVTLAEPGEVTATLCDVSGRLVREWELGWWRAGAHRLAWDGVADDGTDAQPGTYFWRVTVRRGSIEAVAETRIVLVR